MAIVNHWHPVLPSCQLKKNSVAAVRLAGHDLVLFRDSKGQLAALEDRCPHRRMKLSLGKVYQDKLQCPYHGWTFDAHGSGESPATPKLHACARSFEVCEQYEAIWLRAVNSTSRFPQFDVQGHYNVCNLYHRIKAPLELVLDNFCEIEHTATTHALFGYPLERLHEVQVEFQPTDTSVRVINHGPSKDMSFLLRTLVGVGSTYEFVDDWTTYFSPVYSIYDHYWRNPENGKESRVRWRLYIFFVPIDECETGLFSFTFTKSSYPGPAGGVRLFQWLMRAHLDYEIQLDVRVLEGLADKDPSIAGMKLSRFDRVLALNRDRIAKIYRGQTDKLWLPKFPAAA